MIPARYSHIVFSLLLSGLMSFIVSGVSTAKAVGVVDGFAAIWIGNWVFGWAVAFPSVLLIAPGVRRIVARFSSDHRQLPRAG